MGASTPSNFRYPIGQTLTSVRNGAWLCPQAPMSINKGWEDVGLQLPEW